MRVNNLSDISFKAARINIIANSDNHGNITNLPETYNTITVNRDRIFQKSDEKSTLNLYINAGDYFINGNKKGWRTNEKLTNFDVQKDFLRLLILKINKQVKLVAEKNRAKNKNQDNVAQEVNFDALYTPGNHCFDGGDEKLYKVLNSIDGLTTVMTNVDGKNSKFLSKYGFDEPDSKFVSSKEYEIPDDKDKNKTHHLMVLGATIPAFDFYNPGLIKGTSFVENHGEKDAKFTKDMIQSTIQSIKDKVTDFKEKHPNGIVILSSHMGTNLSKMVRDEVPEINEILDGHKHDIATTKKGECNISSLGEDNKILKAIALQIEDDGTIEREDVVYQTNQYKLSEHQTNSLQRLIYGYDEEELKARNKKSFNSYEKDVKPIVFIKTGANALENPDFEYRETIRFKNSHLANFLTSALKSQLIKTPEQKDVDVLGIQSSIIRGGLKNSATTFDLMKIFDGVSEDLSGVKSGEVTGQELLDIVWENVSQNIENRRRNTIIHWSDIQVNRTAIEQAKTRNEVTDKTKTENILVRKGDSFEKIDPKKTYKIAIADKYLEKNDIEMPKKIRSRFQDTNFTYHQLFMDFLEDKKWGADEEKTSSIEEFLLSKTSKGITSQLMQTYLQLLNVQHGNCIKYITRDDKEHIIPLNQIYKEERIK